MICKNISICGAPLAGKASLIKVLKQKYEGVFYRKTVEGSLIGIRIKKASQEFIVYTSSGVHWEVEEVVTELLLGTDLVVYLFSTCVEQEEMQIQYFEIYKNTAQRLGKLWSEIPWIFVLNEIGGKLIFPEGIYLHLETQFELIRVNVQSGDGVDLLWKQILKTAAIL